MQIGRKDMLMWCICRNSISDEDTNELHTDDFVTISVLISLLLCYARFIIFTVLYKGELCIYGYTICVFYFRRVVHFSTYNDHGITPTRSFTTKV